MRLLNTGVMHMGETMKAVEIETDGPLYLADLPKPEPGANEVLVKTAFSGLNRADLVQRAGAAGKRATRSAACWRAVGMPNMSPSMQAPSSRCQTVWAWIRPAACRKP